MKTKIFIYIFKFYRLYFLKNREVTMNNENENYPVTDGSNRPIIYFNNDDKSSDNEKTDSDMKKIDNQRKNTSLNDYLIACTISILLYLVCAWGSQIAFTEVIDLELPLAIFFTIILTSLSLQGYTKIAYLAFAAISCVCFFIGSAYTFIFVISLTGNVIYKVIEWISLNRDYFNTPSPESKIIRGFPSRMKYYVILSLFIFLIFVVLGYFYAGVFQPIVQPSVNGIHEGVQQGTVKLETIPLFMNNFSVAMKMVMGGLYFSTMTIYLLVFNALVIGYSACITNLGYFLSFTLPHGIIELFAIVLAGAAGFRVTHSIFVLITGIKLRDENRREIFIDHVETCCKMLTDVLIMIIIIAVMLIIAAYIEANLTIPIGKSLYEMIYLPQPL